MFVSLILIGLIGVIIYIILYRKRDNDEHSTFETFIIFISISLVIIGISGMCNNQSIDEKSSENIIASEPSDAGNAQMYNIGDTASIDDCTITLNEMKKSNGSEFNHPKEGNEYIILNLSLTNGGNHNLSLLTLGFKMKNSNGQIIDPSITSIDDNTSLNMMSELAPNGKITGTIVFEEPKNDHHLQFIFQPNMFLDEHVLRFNLDQ